MKPLRERLTPELVKALEDRTLTNAQVAKQLQVNPSYLSTVFNRISKKTRGPVAQQREFMADLVECRRETRLREAIKVVRGTKTLQAAAKASNCSERTLRRYMEQAVPNTPQEAYE